jgi:superfamily II DNA or RNA helicase
MSGWRRTCGGGSGSPAMTELAPHQREAVARILALLDRYGGAILADDVGLGKSFVAAAVAAEMQARRNAIELIVPAALVAQWRDTLREFDVDASTITHDSLIGDRFAGGSARRFLVVDEAHAFRNPRTQRYAALARRSIGARLLLVTATPVCNSADDLLALIALVAADDALRVSGVASIGDAFAARDATAIDLTVSELVIRRERDVLPDALRFGELERRVIRHRVLDAPIDDLQFPLTGSASLLRQFLWRRLESSHAALLESVRRQLRFYERIVESGRPLTRRDYRRAFSHEEESDGFQQILFWDLWAPQQEIDLGAIRAAMERLAALRGSVERAPDEKRALLAAVMTAEPTLVFTGAAATARDLARHLRCGLATSRDGIGAVDAFRRGAIDLLVSTDLASEGLNLQRAGVVVHYDIPWNPVKLDQRNGRAHRIGQQRPLVRAVYFLPDRDRARVMEIVVAKNRTRRRVLRPRPYIAEAASTLALPARIPADAAAVALLRALRARGLPPPPALPHRHRAGVERLIEEMAREYLDEGRVAELAAVLEREKELLGA